MKKIILIAATLLIFSCSGTDDNSSVNQDEKINPPAWIQGTWLDQDLADAGYSNGVKFTSTDFCIILLSNSTCYNEQPLEVEETSTNTTYDITLSGAGSSIPYKFIKVSSNQISITNAAGNTTVTYTKQ